MDPSAALPFDPVNLPFLGARTDTHALFQYILGQGATGAGADEVQFAIPGWVALREHLTIGARVTFHLPFPGPGGIFR